MIAFLNAHHKDLEGRPLTLAIESDDGLARVDSRPGAGAKVQRLRRYLNGPSRYLTSMRSSSGFSTTWLVKVSRIAL